MSYKAIKSYEILEYYEAIKAYFSYFAFFLYPLEDPIKDYYYVKLLVYAIC